MASRVLWPNREEVPMRGEDTVRSGFHAGLANGRIMQLPQFTTSTHYDALVLGGDKPFNLTERILLESEKPTMVEAIANYTVGLAIVVSHVIMLALRGEDAVFVDRKLTDR
jgi:hypothetical protein